MRGLSLAYMYKYRHTLTLKTSNETDSQIMGHCTPTWHGVGVCTIHFKTAFRNEDWEWAALIEFYVDPTDEDPFVKPILKRSNGNDTSIFVRRGVYPNGTIIESRRTVSRDHGHPHLRTRDLNIDPLDEKSGNDVGLSETVTRTLRRAAAQPTGLVSRQQNNRCGDRDPLDLEWETDVPIGSVQEYKNAAPGKTVQDGKKLRILTIGDSITVGFLSNQNGGDGNGYRRRLRDNLSEMKQLALSF